MCEFQTRVVSQAGGIEVGRGGGATPKNCSLPQLLNLESCSFIPAPFLLPLFPNASPSLYPLLLQHFCHPGFFAKLLGETFWNSQVIKTPINLFLVCFFKKDTFIIFNWIFKLEKERVQQAYTIKKIRVLVFYLILANSELSCFRILCDSKFC